MVTFQQALVSAKLALGSTARITYLLWKSLSRKRCGNPKRRIRTVSSIPAYVHKHQKTNRIFLPEFQIILPEQNAQVREARLTGTNSIKIEKF